MLVNELIDLRKVAQIRKKKQLEAKKAREREKARKAEAAKQAKLERARKLEQLERDRAEARRQAEIKRKEKLREMERLSKLKAKEIEMAKKSEERDLARIQDVLIRRALRGYYYAKLTPLIIKRSNLLTTMGFRFMVLTGRDSDVNPDTYEAAKLKLQAQLLDLKTVQQLSSHEKLLAGLPKVQEQVLLWSRKFRLAAPHKFHRKSVLNRIEFFKSSAESLLNYRDQVLAARIVPKELGLKRKIESIRSMLCDLVDEQGNFKANVLPTEREIGQRAGLEALEQRYALSIQSALELEKTQNELRAMSARLLNEIRNKLEQIEKYQLNIAQLAQTKASLEAATKRRFECIVWDENPETAIIPSETFLAVHWLQAREGQEFIRNVYSFVRSRASSSKIKLSVSKISGESSVVSMGRSTKLSVPCYVTSNLLCTIFRQEGLDVRHDVTSESLRKIELTW